MGQKSSVKYKSGLYEPNKHCTSVTAHSLNHTEIQSQKSKTSQDKILRSLQNPSFIQSNRSGETRRKEVSNYAAGMDRVTQKIRQVCGQKVFSHLSELPNPSGLFFPQNHPYFMLLMRTEIITLCLEAVAAMCRTLNETDFISSLNLYLGIRRTRFYVSYRVLRRDQFLKRNPSMISELQKYSPHPQELKSSI